MELAISKSLCLRKVMELTAIAAPVEFAVDHADLMQLFKEGRDRRFVFYGNSPPVENVGLHGAITMKTFAQRE